MRLIADAHTRLYCQTNSEYNTFTGEYAGKPKSKGGKGTSCTFSVAARQHWDPDVVVISRVNPHHQHGAGDTDRINAATELILAMDDKEFAHVAGLVRLEQDRRFPRHKRPASRAAQAPSKRRDRGEEQEEVDDESNEDEEDSEEDDSEED